MNGNARNSHLKNESEKQRRIKKNSLFSDLMLTFIQLFFMCMIYEA